MRATLPQVLALGAFALAFALPVHAQVAAPAGPAGALLVLPPAVEWAEIIPGARFGTVYGQWDQEAHGKLISFDPGVGTPMHVHSGGYHGVVVQGIVTNPYAGDEDEIEMGPGSYWYVPGGAPHTTACVSQEPCLFYTYADGAWDLEVVDGAQKAVGGGPGRPVTEGERQIGSLEFVGYPRSSHGLSRTGEPWLLVDRLVRIQG